jgi:flagellum-specific ATP synthase
LDRDDFFINVFEEIYNVQQHDKIFKEKNGLTIGFSSDLLGRVINTFGYPIDNRPDKIRVEREVPISKKAIEPLKRKSIDTVFSTGVKTIDGLLTVGRGQKVGIFAGSGVGKSTLLSMIVKNSDADIKIIALVGERGREVPEFLEHNLGNDLTNTIVVVATSDESALMRKYASMTATTLAEEFRDQGKNVLLIMDSITRVAQAQREIGLSIGEPPAARGYPPSVFSLLPKILERAGISEKGSVTAFYTVLIDADNTNEPVADQARSILDGHIILDRKFTEKGIYPPINVLKSASRVMSNIVEEDFLRRANKIRSYIALLEENETLLRIGAYKSGMDKELDTALMLKGSINQFLKQGTRESSSFSETKTIIENIIKQ